MASQGDQRVPPHRSSPSSSTRAALALALGALVLVLLPGIAAAEPTPTPQPTDPASDATAEPTGDPTGDPTGEPSGDPSEQPSNVDPTGQPLPDAATDPTAAPEDPVPAPSRSALAGTATAITIASGTGPIGAKPVVTFTLKDAGGAPISGVRLELDIVVDGAWRHLVGVTTNAAGQGTMNFYLSADQAKNRVRARFAGNDTYAASSREYAVPLRASATIVSIQLATQRADGSMTANDFIRDGYTGRVYFSVNGPQRQPRPGYVIVQSRVAGGNWRTQKTVTLNANGGGSIEVRPVYNTDYRVHYNGQRGFDSGTSGVDGFEVRPYLPAVALPAGAPRPTQRHPSNPRATNLAVQGAQAQVVAIPNATWNHMVGKSWRSGCPVGRNNLRLVRVNYLGFDGYRYRGELVVNSAIATRTAQAFTALYDARIPIRAIHRVDHFGYSSQLRGADDYKSMAADNTSAFNCRGVVGRPSTPSPHSYGRAVDINPWENPYHSATGVVPNTWWPSRSHPQVAWRSNGHQVVRIMAHYGFRWTYGTADAHHFDG